MQYNTNGTKIVQLKMTFFDNLFIHLCISAFIYLFQHLINLFLHLFASFIYLCISTFIYLFLHLCIYSFIYT